jgi:hypothetical protein
LENLFNKALKKSSKNLPNSSSNPVYIQQQPVGAIDDLNSTRVKTWSKTQRHLEKRNMTQALNESQPTNDNGASLYNLGVYFPTPSWSARTTRYS